MKDAAIVANLEEMSVAELFERASARLRRRVPFDAAVWMAADPVTALPTAPTRTENMEHFGGGMPLMVISTVARGDGARARVRAASGRWLVCHASRLRGADGTALVIEPAAASEIVPIIAEAYELSLRERQIAQLIARGTGTAEIAERLHLSPHTVRDYVKALFEKVGVSSRGELVAKLFAEHVAPIHLSAGSHA